MPHKEKSAGRPQCKQRFTGTPDTKGLTSSYELLADVRVHQLGWKSKKVLSRVFEGFLVSRYFCTVLQVTLDHSFQLVDGSVVEETGMFSPKD